MPFQVLEWALLAQSSGLSHLLLLCEQDLLRAADDMLVAADSDAYASGLAKMSGASWRRMMRSYFHQAAREGQGVPGRLWENLQDAANSYNTSPDV